MRRLFDLRALALGLCMALGGATGCSSVVDALPGGLFIKADRTSYPTPTKRIAKLETLAKEASRKSADEQQQISIELAREIRQEDDPIIRRQMLRTLANYSTATATAVVRAGLEDHEAMVRLTAVEALVRQGGSDVAGRLGEVVRSDTDDAVRLAATRALSKFDDPATVPALAVALDDRNPALQYRAIQSLKEVTGRDYGDDVAAWQQFASGGTPAKDSPSLAERFRRLF